jgi:hypothetical protein
MKRLFAILVCVAFSTSLLAALPRQQPRVATRPAASVMSAVIRLLGRLGFVTTGDDLRPPIPGPEARPSNCCK